MSGALEPAEEAGNDLLVSFAGRFPEHQLGVTGRIEPGGAHLVPEGTPQHGAEEPVAHGARGRLAPGRAALVLSRSEMK